MANKKQDDFLTGFTVNGKQKPSPKPKTKLQKAIEGANKGMQDVFKPMAGKALEMMGKERAKKEMDIEKSRGMQHILPKKKKVPSKGR